MMIDNYLNATKKVEHEDKVKKLNFSNNNDNEE